MLTDSMKARASTNDSPVRVMSGAKARNICTDRMSALAREMSWPDCTRSKNENDSVVRCR